MDDAYGRFGFRATPFTREVRVEQRFSVPFIDEEVALLERAIGQRMSAAVIAPAGTGKSTLVRALVARLPEARYRVHYVKTTDLGKRDMCREIAAAVGLPPAGTYGKLVRDLQEHFLAVADRDGLRCVLILDDAHEVRPDVLGILRVLTNFDMDSRLVVSVLLCGQTPLKTLLSRDSLEDIARRLAHYATLRALSRDEARAYIEHRCTIAGARSFPFDHGAFETIFELSRGNLRAIDGLALKALEAASDGNCEAVSSAHVLEARKRLAP